MNPRTTLKPEAKFAFTTDPLIVYPSNPFGIPGLWSPYFALAGVMGKFHYLKPEIAPALLPEA